MKMRIVVPALAAVAITVVAIFSFARGTEPDRTAMPSAAAQVR